MQHKNSIFYSALMLTAVHLLLRFAGTSFQVYLSGKIGAAGIGLLQLTLSVGSFAMVAGMAGIRTGTMYLTAGELGKRNKETPGEVLPVCIRYSLTASIVTAALLFYLAPHIAENWISNKEITKSIRLFAGFLPATCLCGVMSGYYTAVGKIGVLAAVEVAEQLFSMGTTVVFLHLYAGSAPAKACESVILGSGSGSCLTLLCLVLALPRKAGEKTASRFLRRDLMTISLPLAAADILKSGITTTENLMVPKRLAIHAETKDPLASFGLLSGMVFPVIVFPACILFGLADLLISELARCASSGNGKRIRYLVNRSLKVGLIYGVLFGGGMHLIADELCVALYGDSFASQWLKNYALFIPMLYADALVDAMTKGLGQQRICVRYNIITSAMDVLLLYFLLPKWGMQGYFISFLLTHLINFVLSFRRLVIITGIITNPVQIFWGLFAAVAGIGCGSMFRYPFSKLVVFSAVLGSILTLSGILKQEDLQWLKGIVKIKKPSASS